MKLVVWAEVKSNTKITQNQYDLCISAPEIAKQARPGQFLNLYTGRGEYLLPRPISICEIGETTIRLVYQVVGKGTEVFSTLKEGDMLKVLGPLGNGFAVADTQKSHLLVGGGIGLPPLLQLAKTLKGNIQVYVGARSTPILMKEFKALGVQLYLATEDGSSAFKGNVLELLKKNNPTADAIYACGPKGMLQALTKWALDKGIDPQVSMEERMACGIGACVGCTVKIQKKDETQWENLKVCKDGPVFLGSEVIWHE